jgi:transcriptional regulator
MDFEPRSEADLLRLIEEYPLAWVVSVGGAVGFGATPLPLLAETDAAGRINALFGHFALSNPQVAQLRADPRAKILFTGPHGYISPELVSQPGWAPTWNYATAQFDVEVEFRPQENDSALERLVTKMERDRRNPWTIARMGGRYALLAPRVIAFRAHVRSKVARFKLGQDESAQTLSALLATLDDEALVRWMRDFNSPAAVVPPAGEDR